MSQPTSIFLSGESPASRRRDAGPAGAAAHDASSETWVSFTEAPSDEGFCRAWLALQCGMIRQTQAGLLLLHDPAGHSYVPAAIWPDPRHDVTYLTAAAERALSQRRGAVIGLGGDDAGMARPGSVYVACPIDSDGALAGVVVLDVVIRPEAELQSVLRQLL